MSRAQGRVIRSKYSGKCKFCNRTYRAGENVYWERGGGAMHPDCIPTGPKVTATRVDGNLELSFTYSTRVIDIIKSIPGWSYDPAFKVWTVPDTSEAIEALDGYLRMSEPDGGPIVLEKTLNVSDSTVCKDYPFLFAHQAQVVNTVLSGNGRLYLGLPAGTGKTLASAVSMDATGSYPLLIVCLSSLKINWQREMKKFLNKDAQVLSGRKTYELTSDVVIINYDILDDWKGVLSDYGFKGVIFDESTHIKSIKAKRTKAALNVASGVGKLIFLSGTPAPNAPYDLVPPLTALGVIDKFGGESSYVKRYCPPVQTRYGTSYSNYQNLEELHANIKKTCFIAWNRDDLLDLPDIYQYTYYVDVEDSGSASLTEIIDMMDSPTIESAMAALKEVGAFDGAFSKMRSEVGNAKIDVIIEEADSVAQNEKVVVAVHHREVNDAVYAALKKKHKTVQIIGGAGDKKRQEAVDAFQDGDARVLVMSIAAGGVGLNLQNASHMIIGELMPSFADIDQLISRIYRSGQKNKVTVATLAAPGTIDMLLLGLISKKEGLHNALMSGESSKSVNINLEMAKFLADEKRKVCNAD